MACLELFAAFIFCAAAVKLWFKLTTGWCKNQVCLVGKTVIITGANSGIGYETAKELAKRGAKVIIACLTEDLGREACENLKNKTGNQKIFHKQINLESFKSIKKFAKEVYQSEERLDILINNAGIMCAENEFTEDGLHKVMQINYYGPFLLTNLLLGLLLKTGSSRIVNVSSIVAKFAKPLELKKLNEFSSISVLYCKSKLCIMLFTMELAAKLKKSGVTTYSVHPGATMTKFFQKLLPESSFFLKISQFLLRSVFKTPEEGAQTTIYCSTEKNIEHLSGHHFQDCQVVKRYSSVRSELSNKLWMQTLEDIEFINKKDLPNNIF